MELQRKFKNACPKDLMNISFIIAHFGKLTVKGASNDGIMVFSEENQLFTFPETDVREYVKEPGKINTLIKK